MFGLLVAFLALPAQRPHYGDQPEAVEMAEIPMDMALVPSPSPEPEGAKLHGLGGALERLGNALESMSTFRWWILEGCSVNVQMANEQVHVLMLSLVTESWASEDSIRKAHLSISNATFCAIHFQEWIIREKDETDTADVACGYGNERNEPGIRQAACMTMGYIVDELVDARFSLGGFRDK